MAEENGNGNQKPELDLSKPAPELPKPKRLLPKRAFKIDKQRFAEWICDGLKKDLEDVQERNEKRIARMQKLVGWLPFKDWPWEGCANPWVPAMRIVDLKMRGALENALKSVRPLMQSKARQSRNAGKEAAIDDLLDFQFFVENEGEKIIDDLVAHFCQDEVCYLTGKWVKESQTFHDTRIFPPLDTAQSIEVQLLEMIRLIYPDGQRINERMTDNEAYEWEVNYRDDMSNEPAAAKICFYEMDDGKVQAVIVTTQTTQNGPVLSTPNFEDIVFPIRSANLQPPSDSNPDGAPYYNELFTFNLDVCKRRMMDGTYDLLTEEDFDQIAEGKSAAGSGDEADIVKEKKDQLEGSDISSTQKREDRQGIRHFGRYDVDGDGLEEDVIAWVARDSKKLMKVALLTEHYPGLPIRRPIAHSSFVPNPDRVIGQSQAELIESLQDSMQELLAQHIDYGTLTNTPMGFYRAASGLKGEPMAIEPGIMFPLDNPAQDVVFPTWPTKDSGFALNTMAVLNQFQDKLTMFGDTSYGRVPQGKASALRTVGTTMALLAPGDERSEMILRRMFALLAGGFQLMHLLNRRYLPREKEIRVIGLQAQGEGAYLTTNPEDIDALIDFEFKGSMINSNKQMLSQELTEAMSILVSPLAMQLGIVTPEEIYVLFRDKLTALNQDPDKYMKRPPNMMPGPALSAEEVISTVIANEPLQGSPQEAPQEHLMKIQGYMDGSATVQGMPIGVSPFNLLNAEQKQAILAWTTKVQLLLQQQMMMMQAAGEFQGRMGGGGEGPGGSPTTISTQGTGMSDNAKVGQNELIDESTAPAGTA